MSKLDANKIRKNFPIFSSSNSRSHRPLIYLDSAATSQKPKQVIDALTNFYSHENSNVARGLYELAENATLHYEETRAKVATFIHSAPEEIIFTKGTTESINLVMRGWGDRHIKKGDKILCAVSEHHSNFVPWQELARRKGAKFELVSLEDANGNGDGSGRISLADAEKKLKGARLFAFSAASNVLGTINDVRALCKLAKDAGALSVVDGAQSVPCMPTDVKKFGCDFLAFSGHKMLAPFGVGVLYGKRDVLEQTDPLLYGSGMISKVTVKTTEFVDGPGRFEPGTPDPAAVAGLGVAIDYLNSIGMEAVLAHEQSMSKYAIEQLNKVDGLRILGSQDYKKRIGLIAFTLGNAHPHDVAAMLAEENICVRSGHHCAMPLHDLLGIAASTRASFYVYNTKDDVDALVRVLKKVANVFG